MRKYPLILNYHNVGDYNLNLPAFNNVNRRDFFRQIAFLKSCGFRDVTPEQSILRLEGKNILLTFDDGYYEHVTNVLPVLEKFNFRALFFIPVFYIGHYFNSPAGEIKVMDTKDIKFLKQQGHFIGSHSLSHRVLSELSKDQLIYELVESRRILKRILNSEVRYFSYPFGKTNKSIEKFVKIAGYTLAFSGFEFKNWINKPSPYNVLRISIGSKDSFARFLFKIACYLVGR